MGVHEAQRLLRERTGIARGVCALHGPLEWRHLTEQLEHVLGERYEIGRVVGVEQLSGGEENLSFAVYTQSGRSTERFFVRKHRLGTVESEICFEHEMLAHLCERGFGLAACPVANRVGETLTQVDEVVDGETTARNFAVFSYLDGEDRYVWCETPRSLAELASSARVLARLHEASHDFDPGMLCRLQEPVVEFIPWLSTAFAECAELAHGTVLDREFLGHLDMLRASIERSTFPAADLERMPYFPLHADFHAGNQKYAGDDVVGVFDFDDAKVDYRVFELALAVANQCTSWDSADDGRLRLEAAGAFLGAYQEECRGLDGVGPMDQTELTHFRRMIVNAQLNLASWVILVYYADDEPAVDTYVHWLRHHMRAIEYLESQGPRIEELAAGLVV